MQVQVKQVAAWIGMNTSEQNCLYNICKVVQNLSANQSVLVLQA